MLLLGRLASNLTEARAKIEAAFASGAAAERFAQHGRSARRADGPAGTAGEVSRAGAGREAGLSVAPGTVQAIDTRGVGFAIVALGGGRSRAEDRIDHSVGIVDLAGVGDTAGPERPLGIVHARSEAGFAAAEARLRQAYRIGEGAADHGPLVTERITESSHA
jgi:thymidine phosphorylase